jgi:hypothetical protein
MRTQKLLVNSATGGRGDIWMRLVGFYAIAGLKPELDIRILIPSFLRPLAQLAFGDRLTIMDDEEGKEAKLSYTALGIRHLLKGLLKGERYICSFQRTVIEDKKKKQLKDYVNILIFKIADSLNLIKVPALKWSKTFHGFLEIVAIKEIRKVDYETFKQEVEKDYPIIYERLNGKIPVSPELTIPVDLKDNVIIFPTGSSKQFVPLPWALANFPNAYYAFFHADKDLKRFSDSGLKTVAFYKEAGDIIALAKQAKWTISSDSFQSHVLQSCHEKTTIAITEVIKSRVINPSFKGKVVDSVVECHPCLHSSGSLYCPAGFTECQNWHQKIYTDNLVVSVEE